MRFGKRSVPLGGGVSLAVSAMKLDGNHHGKRTPDGDWETLRNTARVFALGRDSYLAREGRRTAGWRFYLYGRTGSNISLDLMLRFEGRLRPWRAGKRYGPLLELGRRDMRLDA